MTELYAVTATILLIGLSFFQLILALGAPLGNYAWGGAHTKLPTKLRVASLFSIVIYGSFAVLLLAKAGLIETPLDTQLIETAIWAVTVYLSIGIPMNLLSRSKKERYTMTPLVSILVLLFLLVSFG